MKDNRDIFIYYLFILAALLILIVAGIGGLASLGMIGTVIVLPGRCSRCDTPLLIVETGHKDFIDLRCPNKRFAMDRHSDIRQVPVEKIGQSVNVAEATPQGEVIP